MTPEELVLKLVAACDIACTAIMQSNRYETWHEPVCVVLLDAILAARDQE